MNTMLKDKKKVRLVAVKIEIGFMAEIIIPYTLRVLRGHYISCRKIVVRLAACVNKTAT